MKNARKFISENKVDVIVGPNITPSALAMLDPISEAETPMITLIGSAVAVEPQDAKRRWAFKMAANDSAMADVMTRYMANHGIKTVGFIGFADAYGESWWKEFSKFAELRKLKVVAQERFNRTDTSVTGQILKLMAAKPDAVLVAGSGTPAALPQRTLQERGYAGKIYQTHGIATYDFVRVGARTWKARCSRLSRVWLPRRCRPGIRRARRRWRSPSSTRPNMAPIRSRSSPPTPMAYGICSTTPYRAP